MLNREKVIKCLEACTGEQNDCAGHTCPYWDFDGEVGCRTQMELDALALLKEQEAPKWRKIVMSDVEKAINGIKTCFTSTEKCSDCPYDKEDFPACEEKLRDDIVSLLKELSEVKK